MNYWITTDTHFGHDKLKAYAGRPEGFENLIMKRHADLIDSNDVLIHLGDFCIGDDQFWHTEFMAKIECKKWLCIGNHDKKSVHWYLNHGWDFAAHSISLRLYGLQILLSHIPQPDNGYDLNIHGHFHNTDHRSCDPELTKIINHKHKLVMLEHTYKPVTLRSLAGQ